MKLQRLYIKQLFNRFDYDISFENKEDIMILTGANGVGKTVLLNAINSIFTNIDGTNWFNDKNFKEFYFYFSNGLSIEITKNNTWDSPQTKYYKDEQEIEFKEIKPILQKQKAYFIKEERLKQLTTKSKNPLIPRYSPEQELTPTISILSQKLSEQIGSTNQAFIELSKDLDASFPQRLLNEKNKINEADFNARFKQIQAKQEQLKKHGLWQGKQEDTSFSPEDAKVLLVYLNDTEAKLAVFNDLLARLELFTNILNERRLLFKKITINPSGFQFRTDKNEIISFENLSSGEQHEAILLFELLFSTEENMLVLIDEPEISLHITWQKAFIDDLLEILKLRNMQIIIATHSPQIVNGHWDLVHILNPNQVQEV